MIAPGVIIRDEATPTLAILPAEMRTMLKKDLLTGGEMVKAAWAGMLSGPATPRRLGVRSGNLKRSIQVRESSEVHVRVAPDDSHAWLSVHEFGFNNWVHVKEHRVRSFTDSRGREHSGHVRSQHPRMMRMPKRPSRGPAIKLAWPAIEALFQGDTGKALATAHRRGKAMAASSTIVGKHMGAAARRGKP